MGVEPVGDFAFNAIKSSSANKQDIFRVDRYHLLVRVFASALGRHVHYRTFKELQQSLLHSFTADVTCYGRIVAFAGDFVDFVNKNNATFGTCHIIVSSLKQPCKQAFYILADISGFGEHRCIDNSERYIQQPCNCLGKKCFPGAGRTYDDDVALFNVYVAVIIL